MTEGVLLELPRGWVWTKLGDIAEKINPGFPSGKHNKEGNGVPHLRPMNVNTKGEIELSEVKYVQPDSYDSLLKGDVLFNNTNSPKLLGKTSYIKDNTNWAYSNHMTRIRLNSSFLNSVWISYYIHSLFLSGFFKMSCTHHVNQASINSTFLSQKVPIPLPPILEQRAIVSKIEQLFSDLDNGIENFKKAHEQIKIYRQAVLKNACEGKLVPTEAELARSEGRDYEPADVLLARILEERREKWNGKGKYKEVAAPNITDLPMLPEGWGWISIDQISRYIVDCLHSTAKFIPDGKYCIDTNCIEQGKILFEKARFVSEETYYERVSRLVPQADDILFAREGTIGTAVLVPKNIELCLGQRMMMFRAANGVIPLYFMWALQSQIFEKQWKAKILGSTVPHVNIGDIKVMAMSLPPTSEQCRIVVELERRLSICDNMEATIAESLQKAESLRQSILKKAFEGKLLNEKELEEVRNAPDWEPAEKLLERIKAEKTNMKAKKKGKK